MVDVERTVLQKRPRLPLLLAYLGLDEYKSWRGLRVSNFFSMRRANLHPAHSAPALKCPTATSETAIREPFRMGSGKKEANRRERQGKTSDGMSNVKVKGENFYR